MSPVSRIILDPLVLTVKPVIRGTRISVDLVPELLASGWHESSILKEYPGLEREDILACIRERSPDETTFKANKLFTVKSNGNY